MENTNIPRYRVTIRYQATFMHSRFLESRNLGISTVLKIFILYIYTGKNIFLSFDLYFH